LLFFRASERHINQNSCWNSSTDRDRMNHLRNHTSHHRYLSLFIQECGGKWPRSCDLKTRRISWLISRDTTGTKGEHWK
jgi:hypothetical protein